MYMKHFVHIIFVFLSNFYYCMENVESIRHGTITSQM